MRYREFLAERFKWATRGPWSLVERVAGLVGLGLACATWARPAWVKAHISDAMSVFLLGVIPLAAGFSVFAVRWIISPWFVVKSRTGKDQQEIDRLTGVIGEKEALQKEVRKELAGTKAELRNRSPKLRAEIITIAWNESDGATNLILRLQIRNEGTPSIAQNYRIHAVLPDGKVLDENPTHFEAINMHETDGTSGISERVEKKIYDESIHPIPEGGQVSGWLLFRFAVPRASVCHTGTELTLSFSDVRERKTRLKFNAIRGEPLTGKLPYFPSA